MPRTIALVACVSRKHSSPLPARELYTSDWFRKASAYAEQVADEWYILSAKHGLLAPGTTIEPYNETLNRMPAPDRRVWARRVLKSLERVLRPGDRVVILAGQRYREHLVAPIQRMGCCVDVPMEGLGIGKQLRWLKDRIG